MSILESASDAGHAFLDPISAKIRGPFSHAAKPSPSLMPEDFPDGFKIVEYVNGIAQDDTSNFPPLRLVGNMMPMQPFVWDKEQRLIKEWYPGNNEAAVQMLGIKSGDLVIKGRFKDKKYKDTSYYGVSYKISQALEEMQKRGNVLRFGLEGSAGSWIRYGFLEKVNFKMNKLSWVDYELTFFVVGESLPRNAYFAAPEKSIPSSNAQQLISAAAAFQLATVPPITLPQSIASKINGLVSDVAQNINLVTGFVQNILSVAQDVKSSAQRALGLVKNLQSTLARFQRQVGELTNSTAVYSKSTGAASRAKDTYANLQFVHEASAGTHILLQQTKALQEVLIKLAITVPIARYLVRKGDTLQQISVKYYGVSDNANLIQTHNKLQSTILVEGTVLEIPKV